MLVDHCLASTLFLINHNCFYRYVISLSFLLCEREKLGVLPICKLQYAFPSTTPCLLPLPLSPELRIKESGD